MVGSISNKPAAILVSLETRPIASWRQNLPKQKASNTELENNQNKHTTKTEIETSDTKTPHNHHENNQRQSAHKC